MADLMQQARELLAAEYERCGELWHGMNLRHERRAAPYAAEIAAIAAALRAAPECTEGYVLVPVEPTDEMCAAALARIKEVTVIIDAGPAKGATLVRDPHYHAYKAMLAARPQGVNDAG